MHNVLMSSNFCQIIYINFVELESVMLHDANFQDHLTSGSEEKHFQRNLPYMGVTAILDT